MLTFRINGAGGFPSTCPSWTQDPLVDQGRYITRMGSLRLNQDKLRLAPKVKFSFFHNAKWYGQTKPIDLSDGLTMLDEIDRPNRLDLLDRKINFVKSSRFLACVVNHAWCLSFGLDTWCLSTRLDTWCLRAGLYVWRLSAGLDVWRLSVGLDVWHLSTGLDAWRLSIGLHVWRLSVRLDAIYT